MNEKELVKRYIANIRVCAGQLCNFASKLENDKETEMIGAAIVTPCIMIIRSLSDLEDLFKEEKEQ